MVWKGLFFLSLFLLGLALFLYGANFYDAVIGWIGIYFILGSLLAFLILYIYNQSFNRKQN
ncbi:MAG: hypothetical protein ACXACB_00120 [Promethearchaeota archaeon]